MDYFVNTQELTPKSLAPGFEARMVHTDGLTIAHVRIEAGSTLPEHEHPHEQITNVLEGIIEIKVGGETSVCTEGSVVVIPGNTLHSARALTDCRVVDVFRPARDDYR